MTWKCTLYPCPSGVRCEFPSAKSEADIVKPPGCIADEGEFRAALVCMEMGHRFPNTITAAPSSDIRQKITVKVTSIDQVERLQRMRYEILSWER